MPEKTFKTIKIVFFKMLITKYISQLPNLGAEKIMPSSALRCENLPALAPENIKWMYILKLLIKKLFPFFFMLNVMAETQQIL